MIIKLINIGKIPLGTSTVTAFTVQRDGAPIGTAYRAETGDQRGNYEFCGFTGSRARLIAFAKAL
jgi:hypothetical protein